MLKQITQLIKHEFSLELKQKHFVSSIVLYIVSTVFVCYLAFDEIKENTIWNALFWIIILFSLTNAISKSFLNENSNKQLFLYTLINPRALILGKIIYNLVLSIALVFITFVIYTIFVKTELTDINYGLFSVSAIIGSMGISSTLTMISAIASKTNNNIGILSILAFPLILPSLLLSLQLSNLAILGGDWSQANEFIVMLLAINILIIALSFLLFPYLWRE